MALTENSRFTRVQVNYDPVNKWVVFVEIETTDNTWEIYTYVNGKVKASDKAKLDILRAIYNSDDGFQNASDEALAVTARGASSDGDYTLDQYASVFGIRNPFLYAIDDASDALVDDADTYKHIIVWQKAASEPDSPPADWWDEKDKLVTNIGSWHLTRAAAAAANTDSTHSMYFAVDSVSVDENNRKTFNGWEVHEENDPLYSIDGITWIATRTINSIYFSNRLPDGNRKIFTLTPPTDIGWVKLASGFPYRRDATRESLKFHGQVNLNLYKRLRFTIEPFGNWSGSTKRNVGAQATAIVEKPIGGWKSAVATTIDDDDVDGTAIWHFDEAKGLSIVFQGAGSADIQTIPAAVVRENDSDGIPQPMVSGGGKFKFLRSSGRPAHMVHEIQWYDFSSGMWYDRWEVTVEGAI